MATAAGRDDGDARAAAAEVGHSSSDGSDPEEDEIATISDVFSDMLIANEDLLHAAAQYQLGSDVPSILAYQRIIHRNLMEMADFVDSVFGVYNKTSAETNTEGAPEENEDVVEIDATATEVSEPSRDDVNGHTSEDAVEPASIKRRQPERMRSLLIDRFRLENKRRLEQRTARLWRKMRRKVRVEEGVSVVMTQAAERIAQMTVSVAAARKPPREPTSQPSVAARPTVDPVAPAPMTSPVATTATAEPSITAQQEPSMSPKVVVESSTTTPALSTSTSPVPPASMPNESAPPGAELPPPAISLVTPSMPLAPPPPGGAMLVPIGPGTFSKVPLPPMSSGLNMLFTMPTPTLYPPNHMSTVCPDCVSLNRTAHECRSVLKHITPSTQNAPPPVMPSMWPIAFTAAPTSVRSMPPMRTTTTAPSTTFKRMCEECKKTHKSVHHCRKILGHTTPEWLTGLPEADPQPRKRRARRTKQEMEAAARQLAAQAQNTPAKSSANVNTNVAMNEV